jgi:hypothetical protein
MLSPVVRHIRGNAVAYLALFTALGGTSYAAVTLAPGSVTSRAIANGAVTQSKLARSSVGENNLIKHSLTAADFKAGALAVAVKGAAGAKGANGGPGSAGPAGPTGAAGTDGSAGIVARVRGTGTVSAPHGATTSVPLTGGSWTQAGNELSLITGSMTLGIPSTCTGSYGNGLVISVDGVPNTFGLAPTSPASTTVTVPFVVSEVEDPGASAQHSVTAQLANTCTKSGEDYTVSNVKLDVVNFH